MVYDIFPLSVSINLILEDKVHNIAKIQRWENKTRKEARSGVLKTLAHSAAAPLPIARYRPTRV
jgi:hypothetical protein